MNFDAAQLFFVDRAQVSNAPEVGITRVLLYFKSTPRISGNKSGIASPGVTVFLCPTINNVPAVELAPFISGRYQQVQYARAEFLEVVRSDDGSSATEFRFTRPISVKTNATYAIIIKYDGNEDFVLWTNTKGDKIVGTNNISTGPDGRNVGQFFTYIGPPIYRSNFSETTAITESNAVQVTGNEPIIGQIDYDYMRAAWKPVYDTTAKFEVDIARYSVNGIPVAGNSSYYNSNTSNTILYYGNSQMILSNNLLRVVSPSYPMEYIYFDKKYSASDNVNFGDAIFQSQPYYPVTSSPATIDVANQSAVAIGNTSYLLPNGANFSWDNIYSFSPSTHEYIVIVSLNHDGSGQHRVNVRQVSGRDTNTAILLSEPVTFTNSSAYFFKSPVGYLSSKSRPYVSGFTRDLIILRGSNANGSCRFVNNCITSANIVAGGNGYSNTDYMEVTGYENVAGELLGGYKAVANVVTNGNGRITAIYFQNTGAGFVNTDAAVVSFYKANGAASSGNSANVTVTSGAVLYSALGNMNVYFSNCQVVNFDAQNIIPDLRSNQPLGTVYNIKYKSLYYSEATANTLSGRRYLISADDSSITLDLNNRKRYIFNGDKRPSIVSRSNQFVIGYANSYVPNTSIIGSALSNTAVYLLDIYSNNDFTSVSFYANSMTSYYGKYNINNDYTNEHTNYGNAYSKGISVKYNLKEDTFAEDLIVYLTAFRPANTDFKVYARLHNSTDGEAFDDKDWTLLEQTGGIGLYSNPSNPEDTVELSYGLPLYPNAQYTLGGVVSTQLNSATITGAGTTFSSNLAVGDLVRIYQPLFANDDYVVAVVNSITNNTSMTIKTPISNSSVVAFGMKVDKIGYPMQVFKYLPNQNVARYYDSSKGEFDTYDTMQLKIVFLSPNEYSIPKADDVRAVMVTA